MTILAGFAVNLTAFSLVFRGFWPFLGYSQKSPKIQKNLFGISKKYYFFWFTGSDSRRRIFEIEEIFGGSFFYFFSLKKNFFLFIHEWKNFFYEKKKSPIFREKLNALTLLRFIRALGQSQGPTLRATEIIGPPQNS